MQFLSKDFSHCSTYECQFFNGSDPIRVVNLKKLLLMILFIKRFGLQCGVSQGSCLGPRLVIRDLKIPRRDEPGRLPEVNLLNRACAEELENHRSAVLVSSRTSFHQSSRRVEDVSILLLFVPYKCSNRPYF